VDAATFSYLEVTIGAMSACLPTLRPLVARLLPSTMDTSVNHSAGYAKHHDNNLRSDNWRSNAAAATLKEVSKKSESSSTSHLTDTAGRNVELGDYDYRRNGGAVSDAEYHVSVRAGRSSFDSSLEGGQRGADGIKATTVVVQTRI
jgi:hypothetical protein